jgi:tyrosine-protein kinase Etk/Wzc
MSVPDAPSHAAEQDDTVSLLDLVGVLVRRWRLIAGSTTCGALLIFAYVLLTMYLPPSSPWNLLPDIYRPEAKVLLLERESSRLSAVNLALERAGSLGELLGGVGGGGSSAALAQELLAGRTIHDRIIDEFDFVARYGITDNPRTRARAMAERSLKYEFDLESAVLSISYEETDAEFAARVLKRTLGLLEQRFHALTMETVVLKKQHLEERLAVVGTDRQAAQDRLVAFHRAYGIIDLQEQSRELAQLLADYKRELLSKEVEMQSLRESLPASDPSVVQLQGQIDIVRQVLDELQTGFRSFSAQTIPQDELPGVAADHLNLRRDLEIQEQIYVLLREQYELARIEESDPSRTFQVLEAVEVPEVKHWPSRALICVVGTLIVLLLSMLLAFFLEYLVRVRADPVEAAKLAAIREQFPWRPSDRRRGE